LVRIKAKKGSKTFSEESPTNAIVKLIRRLVLDRRKVRGRVWIGRRWDRTLEVSIEHLSHLQGPFPNRQRTSAFVHEPEGDLST
jgi:hypothetical protein